jgi:urease accessory protein
MAEECDQAFLAALQLGDAFLPTGAYTLSQGLESMVQLGWVVTRADLEETLEVYLREQIGPADAVATANACRASACGDIATLVSIDRHVIALKLPRELREATGRTGRNLLHAATRMVSAPSLSDYSTLVAAGGAAATYPVVLGIVGQVMGLSVRQTSMVCLYSATVGMLGAALRLMRIDHITIQEILSNARPLIADLATTAETRAWQEMRSTGLQLDIAAMTHEQAQVRLFSS